MQIELTRRWAVMALYVGTAAPALAQLQPHPIVNRPVTSTTLEIRLASEAALPGYQEFVLGEDVFYVASRPYLSSQDIASVEPIIDGGRSRVLIQLSASAVDRGLDQVHGRLAIFANGHLMAVPLIHPKATAGTLLLYGLLPGQTQRVGRLLSAAPTAPAGPMIFLVASTAMIATDQEVAVEVFVNAVENLRGIQVALDVTGGIAGQLERDGMLIDFQREDYLFGGAQVVSSTDERTGRILTALYNGGISAEEPAYVGTFLFRASDEARGTFHVSVRTERDTLLRDSAGLPIGFRTGNAVSVSVGVASTPAVRR